MNIYIITGSQHRNPWIPIQMLILVAVASLLWATIQTAVFVASEVLLRSHRVHEHVSQPDTTLASQPRPEVQTAGCMRHVSSQGSTKVFPLAKYSRE